MGVPIQSTALSVLLQPVPEQCRGVPIIAKEDTKIFQVIEIFLVWRNLYSLRYIELIPTVSALWSGRFTEQ
jgi:hypothetical protein